MKSMGFGLLAIAIMGLACVHSMPPKYGSSAPHKAVSSTQVTVISVEEGLEFHVNKLLERLSSEGKSFDVKLIVASQAETLSNLCAREIGEANVSEVVVMSRKLWDVEIEDYCGLLGRKIDAGRLLGYRILVAIGNKALDIPDLTLRQIEVMLSSGGRTDGAGLTPLALNMSKGYERDMKGHLGDLKPVIPKIGSWEVDFLRKMVLLPRCIRDAPSTIDEAQRSEYIHSCLKLLGETALQLDPSLVRESVRQGKNFVGLVSQASFNPDAYIHYISIDGVYPVPESIYNGDYALSDPLYIHHLQNDSKAALKSFIYEISRQDFLERNAKGSGLMPPK